MAPNTLGLNSRRASIDKLRTFAVFMMVICHFVTFLSPSSSDSLFYVFAEKVAGVFTAPIFLFLVGVSRANNIKPKNGFIIFVLGLLFAFLIEGPSGLFDWDILPLIGFSIVVLFLLKKAPDKTLLLLSMLVVAVAPPLRALSGFDSIWDISLDDFLGLTNTACISSHFNHGGHSPLALLNGFLFTGYFPVFPWLAFPLLGNYLARQLPYLQPNQIMNTGLWLGSLGITLAILSHFYSSHSTEAWIVSPFCFYPNTTSLFLLELGTVLILFALLLPADTREPKPPSDILFTTISQFSLSLYFLHHMVILYPPLLISRLGFTSYLGKVDPWLSFLFSTQFIVLILYLFPKWKKRGFWTIENLLK